MFNTGIVLPSLLLPINFTKVTQAYLLKMCLKRGKAVSQRENVNDG